MREEDCKVRLSLFHLLEIVVAIFVLPAAGLILWFTFDCGVSTMKREDLLF